MARLIDRIQGHTATWEKLRSHRTHLPQAMAFTGPSGIGKALVAWALAQALLCERGEKSPCGECGSCLRVEKRQSEAVLGLDPAGGQQIKLEAAHQVQEFLHLARLSNARVIIINEAQTLNPQAANALLKLVEEPPPATHFLLIVPEISQLLPTLRSRVQVVRFQPLSEPVLAACEPSPAWMLKSARGSLEKLIAFQDEEINTLRLAAFEFLAQALRRQRAGLGRVLELTKEREAALQAVRFLQQGLRDWVALGSGPLIHGDFDWAALPQPATHKKNDLWKFAHQMESDLIGHVDRHLVFENFFYRSLHALD